jgi:hypothetical protein
MVFWTKERAKALAVTVTLYAVSFPFVISLFEGLQGASGSIWARARRLLLPYRLVCNHLWRIAGLYRLPDFPQKHAKKYASVRLMTTAHHLVSRSNNTHYCSVAANRS